jgi:hypothetical protein
MALLHELRQHSLRQHGVGDVEPRELILPRPRRRREIVEEPVVERPVILEFERAQRMGDVLDRVRLAVREVVGRIDAPRCSGAGMLGVENAIERRVAQIDVAGRHVDLGAQHARAVGKLAGAHAAEEIEVLGDTAVAVRALLPRLGQRTAQPPHLLGRQVVDIGLAGADEMLGPVIELLEVVGGVMEVNAPVETEPADVALDGVDILLLLLGRIGVVEPQMAAPAILLGDAEIEADRLGVTDMEIAVRFRRKARDDAVDALGGEVGLDDVADEVAPGFRRRLGYRHLTSLILRGD